MRVNEGKGQEIPRRGDTMKHCKSGHCRPFQAQRDSLLQGDMAFISKQLQLSPKEFSVTISTTGNDIFVADIFVDISLYSKHADY